MEPPITMGMAAPGEVGSHFVFSNQSQTVCGGCILAGPICFIVLGHTFGMAAGTFSCVFVSAMGDRTATWKGSAILALCITIPGCLLFSKVLMLPFPLFRWGL